MRWLRKNLVLILGLLVLLYTFIPIFVVILMSFNDPDSRLIYQFDGFTLYNWQNPCEDPAMCEALGRSIEIALLATIGSTILGTLAAFALVRHHFRGRSTANLVIFLPMAAPEIVLGSSLLALFVGRRLRGAARLLDDPDRAHHVLPLVRRRDGRARGWRAWTTTSNRRRWTSTPRRDRRSGG